MENMEVLKVYNLVNSKGNGLQLELGHGTCTIDEHPKEINDNGYRWRFFGCDIPMPVRAGYWFNGFTESVMLDWLKGNGWYPRTKVNMRTGHAVVFELPKGNEEDVRILPERNEHEECVFRDTIIDLCRNGKMMRAAALYRYANGGEIREAYHAVKEIYAEA